MKKKILTMVMLAMTAVSMSTGAVFAQTLDSSNAQVSSADKKASVEEENTFMGKITSVTSNTVTVEVEKMGKEGRPDENLPTEKNLQPNQKAMLLTAQSHLPSPKTTQTDLSL